MKWVIVAIVVSPFVVRLAFFGACTAKRLLESGVKLSLIDKMVGYFLLAIGAPADAIYNWTVGWYRFGELREITFSSRIQYYVENQYWRHNNRRQRLVDYWTQYLNVADPGHIKV